MNVLVTGGAGFIGSHLVDRLAAEHTVAVADNFASGRQDRLPDTVRLHEVDISQRADIEEVVTIERPEMIFHLAAQIDVRKSVDDPAYDARVNVVGTINVLEAARQTGARVVMASTGGAIYGEHAPLPTAETHLPEPEAPYGTAKFCGEQYIHLFNRLYDAGHVALRLGNVYGPRQNPAGEAGVVSIFAGRVHAGKPVTVFGDGKQTRDYIYVGDVVAGFIAAAAAVRGGVWNIGTGVETSVLELIDALEQVSGHKPDTHHAAARRGELQRSCLDVTAARQQLSWRPQVGLQAGIQRVYQWVEAGEPVRYSA